MSEKQKIIACLATTLTRRFYETLYDSAQSQAKFAQKDLEETLRDKYKEYWQNVSEKSAFVTDILESFTSVVRQYYPEMMPRRPNDLYFYLLTMFIPNTVLEQMDANEKGIAINDIIIKLVDQSIIELLNGNQLKNLIHSRSTAKSRRDYINTLQARIIYIIGLIGDEMKTEFSIDTMTEERNRNKFVPMVEYRDLYEKFVELGQKFAQLRSEYDMLKGKMDHMKKFRDDSEKNLKKRKKNEKSPPKQKSRSSSKRDEKSEEDSDLDSGSDLESNVSNDSEIKDESKFYTKEKSEDNLDYDDDDDVTFQ